jgi:hypothetical protein
MARTYKRDSRGRFAGGGGGGGRKGGSSKKGKAPKTTSARGRAQAVERKAVKALKEGGGAKAAKSKYVAQRARDYYKATGTGKKRSAMKAKAKPSVAERKQALVKKVSSDALAGRKVSSAARSYVMAQQSSKQIKTGKGSKAARRMANRKA